MGKMKVIDGGLFTTVQDLGRNGYRKYGIPISGVMDNKSFELANWLVGNALDNAVLELTMKGGKYLFESEALIGITGALMSPRINGIEKEMNTSFLVKASDELSFGFAERGCRSYLAIQGEFISEEVMGSHSTYSIGKFGGYEGRSLINGDELIWKNSTKAFKTKKAPKEDIPYFSSKIKVKIMEGPEWDWLDKDNQRQFLESTFEVGSNSNRMGIRLNGLTYTTNNRQMVSTPVIPGIIQLPQSGQPIILMKDGQTIGGYPRIAKVFDEDLWRLGQVKPGDKVRFDLFDG